MAQIKVIATDLDGTLIGNMADISSYPILAAQLRDLREKNGTIWVVSTGRTIKSFRKLFAPLRLMGLCPDFVITEHAYIHSLGHVFWLPHFLWNWHIRWRIFIHNLETKSLIRDCIETLQAVTWRVQVKRQTDMESWLTFPSTDDAQSAMNLLREKLKDKKHLILFQNGLQLEIKAVPFTKGLALSELIRYVGETTAGTLAIGDGYNDISMLHPDVAAMIACPANAAPDVMLTVHQHGGHVAQGTSLRGVVETIDAFLTNQISSALPPDWNTRQRISRASHRHNKRSRQNLTREIFLGLAVLLVAVLVLANFRLLPKSGLLMKPFNLAIKLLARVTS